MGAVWKGGAKKAARQVRPTGAFARMLAEKAENGYVVLWMIGLLDKWGLRRLMEPPSGDRKVFLNE